MTAANVATETAEGVELFEIGVCGVCQGEGRVLLGEKCRTCLTNGCAEDLSLPTRECLASFYAKAEERLRGPLGR